MKEVFITIEDLIFKKTGTNLSTLERDIFQGSYQGETYEVMAENLGFSPVHVKTVGAALWEKLSSIFEQKITKKNIRSFVERIEDKGKFTSIVKPSSEDSSESFEQLPSSLETFPPLVPKGPLELNSPFYIKRQESEVLSQRVISTPGGLLRIKGPQKMGKTSLTIRITQIAKTQKYQPIYLNFQLADSKICQDLDRFLKWLCLNVGQQLKFLNQIDQYWDDILGAKMSCNSYFQDYLLPELSQPLVLIMDRVDYIFAYPEIAEDFFALLRAWYEEAKSIKIWQKLRLVLVYATELYLPLNINQSPFNVGVALELSEFSVTEICELSNRYQLSLSQDEIEQLIEIVGGHPYLIQIALHYLQVVQISLAEFLRLIESNHNPYKDYLQQLLEKLQKSADLALSFNKILEKNSDSIELQYRELLKLKSLGLIKVNENEIEISCQLYRQFFTQKIAQLI